MTPEERRIKRQQRKEKNEQRKQTYIEDPSHLSKVCRDFMKKTCERENCRFIHDPKLCLRYFNNGGSCKFKHNCRKNHFVTLQGHVQTSQDRQDQDRPQTSQGPRPQTERRGDDLTSKFVDMNIVIETVESEKSRICKVKENDVVIVKGLFNQYVKEDLLNKIKEQFESNIDEKTKKNLFQLWHNDCHLIANDRFNWKDKIPIFNEIIDKMKNYFKVRVEATRFNLFNRDHFKYYHRDRAAFHKETAEKQDFTICLNLGSSRSVAFRNVKTKTIISVYLEHGDIYCFAKKVNEEWEHAVLKETSDDTNEKRISIVIWGKLI